MLLWFSGGGLFLCLIPFIYMQLKNREISLQLLLLSSLQHLIGFCVAKIGHWFDGMVMLIYYYTTQHQKCNSQSSTTLLCFASRSLPLSFNSLSKLDPLSFSWTIILTNLFLDPSLCCVHSKCTIQLICMFWGGYSIINILSSACKYFTHWIYLSCTLHGQLDNCIWFF